MEQRSWHYNQSMLAQALASAGIRPGDIVFSHVSLGRLGYPEEGRSVETACRVLWDAFQKVLGPTGTLLIPTYTYSIGRMELFDVQNTPSAIGPFSEFTRQHPGTIRSSEPMLAVSGIGPDAPDLLSRLPHTCYGEDSVYDRMKRLGAKICTIGLGLHWATFRHHIEEMVGVPFRFKKIFTGHVRDRDGLRCESWIYYAPILLDTCAADAVRLEEKIRGREEYKAVPLGRSEIVCIDSQDYFDLAAKELSRDPWLSAKGPPCAVEEIIRQEDQRVNGPKVSVSLTDEAVPEEIMRAIDPRSCHLISDGYDAALKALAAQVPMTIHEYPTGSESWGWIVPERWTCHEAVLETLDGRRILSSADDPAVVVSYSQPFDGTVPRDELLEHMIAAPCTPYYYRRDWGFRCTPAVRKSLTEETYRVRIISSFSYSTLKIGEVVIHGRRGESMVFVCDVGRNPAGAALGIEFARALIKTASPEVTCRLWIVSDILGAIIHTGRHETLPIVPAGRSAGHRRKEPMAYEDRLIYPAASEFERGCLAFLERRRSSREAPPLMKETSIDRTAWQVTLPVVSLSRWIENRLPAGDPSRAQIQEWSRTLLEDVGPSGPKSH